MVPARSAGGVAEKAALAAAAIVAVSATALAFLGTGPGQLRPKVLLGGLAFALLLLERHPWTDPPRIKAALYAAVALFGILAFFEQGVFRDRPDFGFPNREDIFHYQLNAKFFPELGYDGLYEASLGAQLVSDPHRPTGSFVRDLRTNRLEPVEVMIPRARQAHQRFEPARWLLFVEDNQDYLRAMPPRETAALLVDYGYNPTPAWTFVGRLFAAHLPTNALTLRALASLDILLVALTLIVVWRSFGLREASIGVAIFGLGYGWSTMYVGSFLRLDWLAAVVCGVCALERRRPGLAGALIAYAALVRVFPVAFLFGPGIVALRDWRRGGFPRWVRPFALGFAGMILVGLAAGSTTGRGFDAWTESAANLRLHHGLWHPKPMSLETATIRAGQLLTEPEALLSPRPSFSVVDADERSREEGQRLRQTWRPVTLVVRVIFFSILLAALGRVKPPEALLLGMAAFFCATTLNSYYWVLLLTLPLYAPAFVPVAFVGLGAGLYGFHLLNPSPSLLFLRYAMLSWAISVTLLAWMLPNALRTIRSRRTGT